MPISTKQAIITLNNLKIDAPGSTEIRRRNKAIEVAKQALRKQIRRPLIFSKDNPFGSCPNCKSVFLNSGLINEYEIKCCPWCGQAIDWSGKNC